MINEKSENDNEDCEKLLPATQSDETSIEEPKLNDENPNKAPKLPLLNLFHLFLKFGLNAWGGPISQIAMIKQHLVDTENWISQQTFNRVYAVYQILPGPEATELCCYFGYLSRGRVGAFVAGMGFILPGWCVMLALSVFYESVRENQYFLAGVKALQPVVAAMVLRAVHKIGEQALTNHTTNEIDTLLCALAILAAFNSSFNLNFFITLLFFGVITTLHRKQYKILSYNILSLFYVILFIYVYFNGSFTQDSLGIGIAPGPIPGFANLFGLGLLGGLVSFGGAYTSIPFMLQEASVMGGWISQKTFMDGVGFASVLPAPMVIFSTFVGYVGGGVGKTGVESVASSFLASFLTTVGMFLPCFSFTIIGHTFWEKIVHYQLVSDFLDGITGSVVGFILVTAFDLLRGSLETASVPITRSFDAGSKSFPGVDVAVAAVIYVVSLFVLYSFKHKFTPVLLVLIGCIGGQFLFR
ncbi:hypothetical protein HK098_002818 [Nowakowskiella sp. JEL0407]|nr:hypothetical protein HK098_002818 [Nowakowskiella sp. JEL0407]